jgi:hypothetical protein
MSDPKGSPEAMNEPHLEAELRRLVKREKETARKRRQRARQAEERAKRAVARNPAGYVVPPMPAGLSAIRKWVRAVHDAYSARKVGPVELGEVRRSASAVGDLYRVSAEIRKSEAALRAAAAQEEMARALAAVEHGGAAVMLLARLQESLTEGKRRPLPGLVRALPPQEPAS